MNKSFWTEKIKIGTLSVPRFMAAPIDGITDSPLRQLIREFNTEELLITEMRHVSCVANEKDGRSLKFNPVEQPLGFQISANRPDFIPAAVEKIISKEFKMINLNCGCPAKPIVKSGSGSALMANLPTLKNLLTLLQTSIKGRVPLTIKIRAGFKETNALDVCKMAQDLGVTCIMIHPRRQIDKFFGPLDYDLVKKIKETVEVPVVFSGNITSFERAKKVYELTGVDGFMIGRALMGAPWKIKEIIMESQGLKFSIDIKTKLQYALKHLNLNIQHYGQHGVHHFKKQVVHYIKEIENASACRNKLVRSSSEEEMKKHLNQILSENS